MIKQQFIGMLGMVLTGLSSVSAQECQLQPKAPKASHASVLPLKEMPEDKQPIEMRELLAIAEPVIVKDCLIRPSLKEGYTTNVLYQTTPFTFMVDSSLSQISLFSFLGKMTGHHEYDIEIKIFVRAEPQQAYIRLLSAIIDKSQTNSVVSARYNHERLNTQVRDGIVFVSNLDAHGNAIGTTFFLPFVYKDGVYPVP